MSDSAFRITVVCCLLGILSLQAFSIFLDSKRTITRGEYISAKDKKQVLKDMPMVFVKGDVDASLNEPVSVTVENLP